MFKITYTEWLPSYRIIPSRFPPIYLYERVVDNTEFEILNELESLTNPRHRDEVGQFELVPAEDRIFGPGSSRIMAAFTHLNPGGSRFSDGTYGVYYAGHTIETAIEETKFHRERFLKATEQKKDEFEMLVLIAELRSDLHDIKGLQSSHPHLYHPEPIQYPASQIIAKQLKTNNANGILYDSVRHPGGECVAIFKPTALKNCIDWKRLIYHWDGERIDYSYSVSDLQQY